MSRRIGTVVSKPGTTGRSAALRYGQALKLGSLTCTSRKSGVTCTNTLGHGFTIARTSHLTF